MWIMQRASRIISVGAFQTSGGSLTEAGKHFLSLINILNHEV